MCTKTNTEFFSFSTVHLIFAVQISSKCLIFEMELYVRSPDKWFVCPKMLYYSSTHFKLFICFSVWNASYLLISRIKYVLENYLEHICSVHNIFVLCAAQLCIHKQKNLSVSKWTILLQGSILWITVNVEPQHKYRLCVCVHGFWFFEWI